MSDKITIEDIKAARETLDRQPVPTEDRLVYDVENGCVIPLAEFAALLANKELLPWQEEVIKRFEEALTDDTHQTK